MTAEELKIMEITRGSDWGHVNMYKRIWNKAADEYNADHPNDKPLKTQCRPCLFKFYQYLKQKHERDL